MVELHLNSPAITTIKFIISNSLSLPIASSSLLTISELNFLVLHFFHLLLQMIHLIIK